MEDEEACAERKEYAEYEYVHDYGAGAEEERRCCAVLPRGSPVALRCVALLFRAAATGLKTTDDTYE